MSCVFKCPIQLLLIIIILKAQSIANKMEVQETILIEVYPMALKILWQRLAYPKLKRNLFELAVAKVMIQFIVKW